MFILHIRVLVLINLVSNCVCYSYGNQLKFIVIIQSCYCWKEKGVIILHINLKCMRHLLLKCMYSEYNDCTCYHQTMVKSSSDVKTSMLYKSKVGVKGVHVLYSTEIKSEGDIQTSL